MCVYVCLYSFCPEKDEFVFILLLSLVDRFDRVLNPFMHISNTFPCSNVFLGFFLPFSLVYELELGIRIIIIIITCTRSI